MTNPKEDTQKDPRRERKTRLRIWCLGVRNEPGLNRDLRINSRVLEKCGPTMGCKGCGEQNDWGLQVTAEQGLKS